jgi:hypothetical protein
MADPVTQVVKFSDEYNVATRLRVEAGHITAVLLQGQDAPLESKFKRLAPIVEAWLRTGTFP